MVLVTKAASGIATRAEGALAHCGLGSSGLELSYSCQGPACSSLDGSFQDVVCHRDGSSTLICSNDVKCQPGTSTYQSNFTLSQNEPDPWSPVMENKPDSWVPQDQHVLVGSCARFSLMSDGTKEGTQVLDEANTCPNVQSPSTPSTMAGHISTSPGRPHVNATQRPLIFAGTGSRRNASKSSFLLTLIFAFILLLPSAQASTDYHHHRGLRRTSGTQTRATSDAFQAFAEKLRSDLAEKASNQGVNGKAFANKLLADVVSSVCQAHFEGSTPKPFEPEILKNCVTSVYSSDKLPQPALQFLAVFGGSLLCNYVVSSTYPSGQDFSSDSCDRLQNLVDKVKTDPTTTATPMSAVPGTPFTRVGSPGVFLAVASSSYRQSLAQTISAVSQPGTSPLAMEFSETPQPSTAAGNVLPSGAPALSSIRLSTPLPAVDDLASVMVPSEALGSVGLAEHVYSARTTAAPPLSQSTRTSNLSGLDPQSTENAPSEASSAAPVPISRPTATPAVFDILDIESATSRLAAGTLLAAPSESKKRPETHEGISYASMSSEVSGSPVFDPSSSGKILASEQGEMTVTSTPVQTTSASLQTILLSDILPASKLAPSSTIAPDRTLLESFRAETALSRSAPSILPASSATSKPLSPSAGTTEDQRTRITNYHVLISALRLSSAADALNDVQSMASLSRSSVTIAFASEDRSSNSRLSSTVTPTLLIATTTTLLEAVLAYLSPSDDTLSPISADRSAGTQAVDNFSFTWNGTDRLKATTATSGTAVSIVSSSSTADTVVYPASMTPTAELKSNLVSQTPLSISSLIATTRSSKFSLGTVDSESDALPVTTTFAVSPAITLSATVVSKTSLVSITLSSSASDRRSQLPGFFTAFPSSPSAFAYSALSSSGSESLSIQDNPTSSITSASLISASASSSSAPLWSSIVITPITLSSSKALMPASSPANMSMSFITFGPSIFVLSPSPSMMPTTVPAHVWLSASTIPPSLNRSTAAIVFESLLTDGSLTTTPSTSKMRSTSASVPATFVSSTDSFLTTSCAHNSNTASFCPGSGCVNLMANKAHCGACDQVCIHECHQGTCVCPDLASPNSNDRCDNKPSPGDCVVGYIRNSFRVCAPAGWPSISSTFTPASNQSSAIRSAAFPSSSLKSTGTPLLSAAMGSVRISNPQPSDCPPSLPDICDGVCFNTKTEHNHCGGCGNFCSGTCVAGRCLTSSTESPPQQASIERMVTTSGLSVASSVRPSLTSTVQPMALYIWRGLAGIPQA